MLWFTFSARISYNIVYYYTILTCINIYSHFTYNQLTNLLILQSPRSYPKNNQISNQMGLSPLAPNQWKPFTLVYAEFFVLSNLVRPIRITIAISIGKYFDSILQYFQDNTKLSRNASIALLVFVSNVVLPLLVLALKVSWAIFFWLYPSFRQRLWGLFDVLRMMY